MAAAAKTTERAAPLQAPLRVLYALNLMLLAFAVYPLIFHDMPPTNLVWDVMTEDEAAKAMQASTNGNSTIPARVTIAPPLTGNRNSTGEFFLAKRIKQGPVVYYGMHAVPALIWLTLMPMQNMASIRSKYRAFHRFSGYVIATCSASLTITGLIFPLLDMAWSHQNIFHIHAWKVGKGVTIFVWPTFASLTTLLGIAFGTTAWQTVRYARARQFKQHEWWANAFSTVGYCVPLQRVWMVVYMIAGAVVSYFPRGAQDWLGVPTIEKEVWEAELGVFAWSLFMAMAVAAIMIACEWRMPKALKNVPQTFGFGTSKAPVKVVK